MLDNVLVDYVPGDVVFLLRGPFQGLCGVVREVDTRRAELGLDIPVGGASHRVLVGFDEVEQA
jgi:transcription antitermination factor NusG